MDPLLQFVAFIISNLIGFLVICLIVNAVIGWLVAFEVIRLNNAVAFQVVGFLDAVTRPILRPFQRFMPRLGGVDLSPLVAILVLQGIRYILLPAGFGALSRLLGAP